jgi:hypothetical protein
LLIILGEEKEKGKVRFFPAVMFIPEVNDYLLLVVYVFLFNTNGIL